MRPAALALLVAAVVLSGCSYAGEPLPPALRMPVRVTDLQATQRGASILVRFTIPKVTTEDLAIQGHPDIELRIGAIDVSFNTEAWQRTSERVTGLTEEQFVATVVVPVAKYAGKTVVIGVNVHGPQGRTAGWSNFVSLPVVSALLRPEGLVARDAIDSVALEWHAAAGAFRVYRRTSELGEWERVAEPTKPSYSDDAIEFGKTYQYYVEAVEKAGDTAALSEQSDVISFKPHDKFAPATPAGFSAVAGARGLELVWERNIEKDLAGYRIYRDGQRLGSDMTAPSYSDQAVQTGTLYRYQVTAFDLAGNESPKSPVAEAEAP